ncbi:MAG TPA: hypothetical protein VEY51_04150 [Chondromyces sp.]|nr:hypothetical protein [Chondromyces sp.]
MKEIEGLLYGFWLHVEDLIDKGMGLEPAKQAERAIVKIVYRNLEVRGSALFDKKPKMAAIKHLCQTGK